jgi:hypothetical protein
MSEVTHSSGNNEVIVRGDDKEKASRGHCDEEKHDLLLW